MNNIPNDIALDLVRELKKHSKTSHTTNDLLSKANNYLTKTNWFNSLSDEEKAEVKSKGVLQLLDELEELKPTEITEDEPVNETVSTPQRVDTISQSDKVEQALNKGKYKSIKRVIAREFLFVLSGFVLFLIAITILFVLGFGDDDELGLKVFTGVLVILFIFRYIYYATKWSIKTLKS
ncbi:MULTISPECIES: hypothetical protein [unclassified Myroides]|uniref:hypothetical protein n=1 Tax=unclassified Myroides TaxID=2642485 RepID=UPI003D2F8C15